MVAQLADQTAIRAPKSPAERIVPVIPNQPQYHRHVPFGRRPAEHRIVRDLLSAVPAQVARLHRLLELTLDERPQPGAQQLQPLPDPLVIRYCHVARGSRNWNQLKQDIDKQILEPAQDGELSEQEHFFGPVVVAEKSGHPRCKVFDIIDGQQRFTTVYLKIIGRGRRLYVFFKQHNKHLDKRAARRHLDNIAQSAPHGRQSLLTQA